MITVTYHYWANKTQANGIAYPEKQAVAVDFDTTDQDHAMELAERLWAVQGEPEGYIAGTLSLS
jgi:hypothetical protein